MVLAELRDMMKIKHLTVVGMYVKRLKYVVL